MQRRQFLNASAAATAALGFPAIVRAQNQRFAGITLSINGYGSDYDRIMQEHIAAPLERATGLKVTYLPGTASAAVAKILASPDNPPFDLVLCDSPTMPDLIKAQAITRVTTSEVKAVSKLIPGMREFGDYGVPLSVSTMLLAYNSNRVKTPIKSYADLARPDLKGRVGIFNQENTGGVLQLIAMAEANGGSVDNMGPGFAALAKVKQNVATITPSTVNMVQLFEQEEIWAAGFWDGRVHSLQKAGRPIAMVVPSEGIYALRSYVSPVKGTKHPEAVNAYLEQTLADPFNAALSTFFGYGPVTDVKMPAEVVKNLRMFGREGSPIKPIDWNKVSANRAAWLNRFNREFN